MKKDIKIVPQNEFINYLKFKIKTIIPSVVEDLNYENSESGYIVTEKADERFKLELECGLCNNIVNMLCLLYKLLQKLCDNTYRSKEED